MNVCHAAVLAYCPKCRRNAYVDVHHGVTCRFCQLELVAWTSSAARIPPAKIRPGVVPKRAADVIPKVAVA